MSRISSDDCAVIADLLHSRMVELDAQAENEIIGALRVRAMNQHEKIQGLWELFNACDPRGPHKMVVEVHAAHAAPTQKESK